MYVLTSSLIKKYKWLPAERQHTGQATAHKQTKRQASKEMLLKWQRSEYQSMTWLRADMDKEDRSIISTLWCVVC